MQVRNIEFQENFGRVTVEGARQQHLLQQEPEVARQINALEAADAHVVNLSRAMPSTGTEGRIVDPAEERRTGRSPRGFAARRNRASVQPSDGGSPEGRGNPGTRIDVVA